MILKMLLLLQQLVASHASEADIQQLTAAMRKAVIASMPAIALPQQAPDRARGQALYQQNCAACHGATGLGDGPAGTALDPAPTLFGRLNILALEKGTPKDKLGAIVNWNLDRVSATLRATRYGEVLTPDNDPARDFTLGAKTLVDIEGRVEVTDNWRLALGMDNIFDQYPEAFPVNLNSTGNTPFSNYSPYGRSGRLVYAKLSYNF